MIPRQEPLGMHSGTSYTRTYINISPVQKCLAGVLALVCGTVKWTSRFVIFRKNNLEK